METNILELESPLLLLKYKTDPNSVARQEFLAREQFAFFLPMAGRNIQGNSKISLMGPILTCF